MVSTAILCKCCKAISQAEKKEQKLMMLIVSIVKFCLEFHKALYQGRCYLIFYICDMFYDIDDCNMQLLSHGAGCNMGNTFRVSHILQLISRAFRRVEQHQNIRNEENICQYCARQRAITTLSLNACLNKIYQELSYLLMVSGLLNII